MFVQRSCLGPSDSGLTIGVLERYLLRFRVSPNIGAGFECLYQNSILIFRAEHQGANAPFHSKSGSILSVIAVVEVAASEREGFLRELDDDAQVSEWVYHFDSLPIKHDWAERLLMNWHPKSIPKGYQYQKDDNKSLSHQQN
ncbi:unnamed protein product [Sphagnum balticum]